ncbi:MAG: hypothetical protein IJV27_10480 [Prevotella sp.]|nr:hypothetical protein [Prevotella sp.]
MAIFNISAVNHPAEERRKKGSSPPISSRSTANFRTADGQVGGECAAIMRKTKANDAENGRRLCGE